MSELRIEEWGPSGSISDSDLRELAGVLHACVHAGASVSFILPFSIDDAAAYWTGKVLPRVRSGATRLLLARWESRIAGTAQLHLDSPPNQQHRAEVAKLLVHPDARRKGVGRKLMAAIERTAAAEGRTLLTLDTRRGDNAEPLYLSLGYLIAGVIPRFARGPWRPDLEDTTIMYKELG